MRPPTSDSVLSPLLADLLVAGADERPRPDPRTGLNQYGCAPRPRPEVLELGSCSGSWLDPALLDRLTSRLGGYEAALARGEEATWATAVNDEIRRDLRAVLGLGLGVSIVLTPSGTDAQLLVAALALAEDGRTVCNVVVAPDELGSGSPQAALGRHFGASAPHTARTNAGEPLAGLDAGRLTAVRIAVRDAAGRPLPRPAVESAIDAAAAAAAGRGERILLHVVAHSKTGIHQPSLEAVDRLRARYPHSLQAVVDFAQGRMARRDVRACLERGFAVIVTGSKFFGGPSFAAALLVPCGRERLPADPLPRGLGDYLSRADLPPEAAHLGAKWDTACNPGLTFRWLAAVRSMRAYYEVPADMRGPALAGFAEVVAATFRGSRAIGLEVLDPAVTGLTPRARPQTVFCLTLRRGERPMGKQELEAVRHALGAGQGEGAFHLGRAVALGSESDGKAVAALRIALGAPLAVRLALDPALGATQGDRMAWLADRLGALRGALEAFASSG